MSNLAEAEGELPEPMQQIKHVRAPILVRVDDEIIVEIAWIVRYLRSRPRRRRDPVCRACDFDLGNDQAVIVAVEYVDLPSSTGECLAMAGLLDERPFAELIEHDGRIGKRDRILELEPAQAHRDPLDGEKALFAGDAHAYHALLHRRQIALTVERAGAGRTPQPGIDEVFVLDLVRHETTPPVVHAI